jgi:tripartite-type tricarboxylate transporter receptor subunit TctC
MLLRGQYPGTSMGRLHCGIGGLLVLLLAACTPAAAPAAPTAAPPAAAATTAPKPAAAASPSAAASPAAAAKPAASPAAAATQGFDEQAVAGFYRGNTVKVVVGFSPGGGYDLYARLIAKYLGKYIPGNPTVIVENQPGAGGILATNSIYNAQPKDGTIIGSFIGTTILQQLFGDQSIQFDMGKMQYIGAPTGDHYIIEVAKAAGLSGFKDVIGPGAKQLVVGGQGPGVLNYDGFLLLRDVLGANIKAVPGYPGSAEIKLAMLRGELDGTANGWESIKARDSDDIARGDIQLMMQWWDTPIPDLPNVPTAPSFATTDEQKQLISYGLILPSKFSRPYFLAPEVPADRVRALDAAFAKAIADPDLRQDADKSQLALDPLTGSQVKQLVDEFLTISPDLVAKLKKSMTP